MSDSVVSERLFDGFVLSSTNYNSGIFLPSHSHDTYGISMVLRGSVAEEGRNSTHTASPTHIVFKPPGTIHSNRFGPSGAKLLRVEFVGRPSDAMRDALEPLSYRWTVDIRGARSMLSLLDSLESRGDWDGARGASSDSLARDIIVELISFYMDVDARDSACQSQTFQRAYDRLIATIDEPMEIRDIAEEVGVHPVYLARVFRRKVGTTICEFRARLRVEEAVRRMAASEEGLTAIALNCGFSDQSHFSRSFRQTMGMTPGKFRSRILSK